MNNLLLSRYKIVRQLGRGGFGDTYIAEDLALPEKPNCVVKHLKPKSSDSYVLANAERLFEKEAKALHLLGKNNDQIPKLFAHFQENGEFYLVQEFIDGQDLTKEINILKTEQDILKLLQDILEVLAFVHENNIIHRDIKPQNIMRRKNGKIVLIDFGAIKEISVLGANSQGAVSQTVAIGTHGYMPSEQASGYPRHSSDIYAVGIIGFQALTGLHPQQLPRDLSGELCCELFEQCANLNPDFAKILDTMVRYDYRHRYQDAIAALKAFQELGIINEPTLVVSPGKEFPSNPLPEVRRISKLTAALPPVAKSSLLKQIFQTLQKMVGKQLNQPQTITPSISETILPSQRFEQPEGLVSLDSHFYVERFPIEAECYETILRTGALIRIKAPRKMGKTSLLIRILAQGKQHDYQTVDLNFQEIDAKLITSLDKFLRWFCASVTDKLNIPNKVTESWQSYLGNKNNCTNYFQKYLLVEITQPIVLGLDEVDQIFQYPEVATEFFGLLRVWHEKSKNEEIWKKLRLVIVHSKEAFIPLNINQSPFNVGLPIELPEFNKLQVQDLVQRHQLTWTDSEIEQLMEMIGGHPYLVRRSLYEIARQKMNLSQFLQTAPTQAGIYSDYLRGHLLKLQEDANLVTAIKEVIASSYPVRIDTNSAFKLRSMGLVKFHGNDVMPLCDLYRQYFREHLGVN